MATDERVSIAKLDVENYAAWSREIKYLLIGRGLWGAVDPCAWTTRRTQRSGAEGKA